MTIQDISQCFMVTGSLVLLLVIPFLFLSSLLTEKKEWPVVVLGAMIIGCSTQAVLGLLWSHMVRGKPFVESLVFLFVCIFAVFLAWHVQGNSSGRKTVFSGGHSFVFLPVILLLAFWIRSIHPLQTFVLGQSDAYSHLHYLNDIVGQGVLINIIYPSGYHWLLALPVLIFKIDPYVMARFSGAFFGTGLVLAIYVFLDTLVGRRAALWGSFCAACFPGMILLMKTGVGAYANQLGLFLIPCILLSYIGFFQEKTKRSGIVFFLVSGMGLAASVPMMLCHIFIVIGLERGISLFYDRKNWIRKSLLVVGACLPAVILIAFHFSQASGGQRFQTAELLTGHGEKNAVVTTKILRKVDSIGERVVSSQEKIVQIVTNSPYFKLAIDFALIKRAGLSNLYLNLVAAVLFGLFVCCIGYGIYTRQKGLLILGLWGGLTTVQASIGLFQFSYYQREGWSLLIATCCLTGVIVALILSYIGKFLLVRAAVCMASVFSVYFTAQHPPFHPALQSSAEDLLIRTVRFLDKDRASADECDRPTDSACRLSLLLDKSLSVTLVSRKFVGWRNQGEIVPNVISHDTNMKTLLVSFGGKNGDVSFSNKGQYVVFVDKENKISSRDLVSAFAMVSPDIVHRVLQQQRYLYRANSLILEYINTLNRDEWLLNKVSLSENLTAYVVIPVQPALVD